MPTIQHSRTLAEMQHPCREFVRHSGERNVDGLLPSSTGPVNMDSTSRREGNREVSYLRHSMTTRAILVALACVPIIIGILSEILSPKVRLSASFFTKLADRYSTGCHCREQHVKERARGNDTWFNIVERGWRYGPHIVSESNILNRPGSDTRYLPSRSAGALGMDRFWRHLARE